MSLAQRVRDIRYTKGWGPDELANRAEISRTALYQIESGKTGLPRAGTLRRIAVALEVPMEDLLGFEDDPESASSHSERIGNCTRPRVVHDQGRPKEFRFRFRPSAVAGRPRSRLPRKRDLRSRRIFHPATTGTRRCIFGKVS